MNLCNQQTKVLTTKISKQYFNTSVILRNQEKSQSEILEKEKQVSLISKTDKEIFKMVEDGQLQAHALEKALGDPLRAVKIRRQVVGSTDPKIADGLKNLPVDGMDYSTVNGACCENVVGYIQIPVGTAGPLLLDGESFLVPMATTEGALVASTHRGLKAISQSGGAHSSVIKDGMTRAPLIKLPSVKRAVELKNWLEQSDNFYQIAAAFNSTSRFARLHNIKIAISGRYVYLRFKSSTGDAMGMNMVSKGVEKAIEILEDYFPDLEALSLSGNYCTDKKPSAVNWIEGRGKSVVCEALIKSDIVKNTLKTTVQDLVNLNISKNLIGSSMAGSIGGFNAHASNIVTAIFLATGQDPAQNVESSNCLTLMEAEGNDLHISVTMPSIEVGTVGGGTHLTAQSSCLSMLGIKGSSTERPGAHAEKLAKIISATVLAGELSLMSALAAGHLVRSHIAHNRKKEIRNEGDIGHTLAGLKSN